MSNPYYRVTVPARVRLPPIQMNNNIMDNIKNEAINLYNNRCYRDYGYIDGIYKISNFSNKGIIQLEDPTSSALFTVDMECRMLVPIPGDTIYSKITGINEKMIIAETGQLKIVIYERSINKENIRYIRNAYYPVDSDGRRGEAIRVGTPVVIKLRACRIVPRKEQIIGIGYLESVVPADDFDHVHDKNETNIEIKKLEEIRERSTEDLPKI